MKGRRAVWNLDSVCWGCSRSHRQAGSHSNSQFKEVIESGGGEERDALREHLSPLSPTLVGIWVVEVLGFLCVLPLLF